MQCPRQWLGNTAAWDFLTGPPHLEALLEILVLLQEHGVVDDDLRRGDAQVQDAVVHGLGGLRGGAGWGAAAVAPPPPQPLGSGSSPERCQGSPLGRRAWTTPSVTCTRGSARAPSHRSTQPGGQAALLPSAGRTQSRGARVGNPRLAARPQPQPTTRAVLTRSSRKAWS